MTNDQRLETLRNTLRGLVYAMDDTWRVLFALREVQDPAAPLSPIDDKLAQVMAASRATQHHAAEMLEMLPPAGPPASQMN